MVIKEPNIVFFKSNPEYWNKESLGLKRNTIRKKDNDERFKLLDKWMFAEIDELIIMIQNNSKEGEIFYRKVTDASKFDDYYIISW